MRFFKYAVFSISLTSFVLAFAPVAKATDLLETIVTREMGSCLANNLSFTAMKFYKLPLNETFEGREVFLRLLFFFNSDGSMTTRISKQALLSCTNNVCSYQPLSDAYIKSQFEIMSELIFVVPEVGVVYFHNPGNSNRGFTLTFNSTYSTESLRNLSFIGGMVTVNFNQQGINTAKLCTPFY